MMEDKTLETRLKAPMPYMWKIQTVSKSNKASCVAYIDARDVMDRLDEVMGIQGWKDSYRRDTSGRLIATLELKFGNEWIGKEDTGVEGNFETEKSEFSDAFKRVAVKWGIGRFLYALDIKWVDTDSSEKNAHPIDKNGKRIYNLTEYLNNQEASLDQRKPSEAPRGTTAPQDGDLEPATPEQMKYLKTLIMRNFGITNDKELPPLEKELGYKINDISKGKASELIGKIKDDMDWVNAIGQRLAGSLD